MSQNFVKVILLLPVYRQYVPSITFGRRIVLWWYAEKTIIWHVRQRIDNTFLMIFSKIILNLAIWNISKSTKGHFWIYLLIHLFRKSNVCRNFHFHKNKNWYKGNGSEPFGLLMKFLLFLECVEIHILAYIIGIENFGHREFSSNRDKQMMRWNRLTYFTASKYCVETKYKMDN